MRRAVFFMGLLVVIAFAGCTSRIHSTPPGTSSPSTPPSYDAKTRPYTVLGRTYYPLQTARGYDEVGMASWYGKDFHGKKTANGYIYNMYGVSAAHKTLPLGTKVRVTNLENNKSVVLVINDRGPFVRGRIIDLSYGAAKALGTVDTGVAKVRISALGSYPQSQTAVKRVQITGKVFHVRVGAFAVRGNAERVYKQLLSVGYSDARITIENRNGQRLHIVQAGSFKSRDKAEQVLERLKDDFPTCYIVS
ncbi:septal ring lytic transglycosylase RlpA family protein [Pseudodesulfovibrio sediminis]|uniref:Probable endolytic peptidoglycan transglycosylase RlpA n=1 Tax=Pseudodesulfovibrio sediminis TaxID=2810563 RepID=A0ABN6ERR3_9BACT|nr:septal ring lytic transglycosylase RlpA family protein [Pseudodesulfovibrio sediminis]BCS87809.1 hypothetical protein PSDVSF_10510 [Pseudodesulfovibrio sediminis]